jgi:cytochrome c oxidase assembly protein subunit 15
MEWGHRILGRLIGIVFVGPFAYYALRKKIPKVLTLRLLGLATLIGAQGAIGWYMVKSGLEDSLMETPGATPRVSQYRLAAHLGMAFLLYFGMFWSGMAVLKDWKFAKGAAWSGYKGDNIEKVLNNPLVRSFKRQTGIVAGLVFLTAISGRGTA